MLLLFHSLSLQNVILVFGTRNKMNFNAVFSNKNTGLSWSLEVYGGVCIL